MREIKVTDIRVVPGDSAFLVDDGETSILYDSGFAFTGYALAEKIKKALGDRELDYIFLTHSHYDHILGAIYVLRSYPNAKVVAGEYATKIFGKASARAVMRDLDNKFAKTNGIDEYEFLEDELHVDIPVKDGDIVEAGAMRYRVIDLPGHTRCSVAFYEENSKLLLSCETPGVFDGFDKVIPSYLVGYNMTLDSIAKIEKLDIQNILIPHLGLLNREETEFYLKTARKHTIAVAEDFMKLINEGKSDDEIIDFYKSKYIRKEIEVKYPDDARILNTSIMIKLVKRELMGIE